MCYPGAGGIRIARYEYPQLKDEGWLRQRYWDELKTVGEIATEIGCTAGAVTMAMQALGIPSRTAAESRAARGTKRRRAFPVLDDAGWLRARYVDEQLSANEIAEMVGCTHLPVLKALRAAGIEARQPGLIRRGRVRSDRITQYHDPEWLRREYIEKDRTLEDIAGELGARVLTVQTRLSKFGLLRLKNRLTSKGPSAGLPLGQQRKGGYIQEYRPDHPAADLKGYVKQHRLVAEAHLGRLLVGQECVHHVNRKRSDNDERNLMVFPNNRAHMAFHANPPAWVPRCPCCGKPNPEVLTGRPEGVPMLWLTK